MNPSLRPVAIWLSATCLVILMMIMVGGITRLTDSGLSIVEWKPILGAIPPLTDADWHEKFEMYKQYPEYQKLKSHMDMSEFKFIYFWEYFHRLLGRLIGVIYFLPFLFFLVKGNLTGKLKVKLAIGFVLGGLQGLLGWYMVKSGLVDRPDVSHFRLAAHFGLALAIVGYLYWIFLGLTDRNPQQRVSDRLLVRTTTAFLALLSLQIVYGAFVAGLDAGIGYNTFPTMDGKWFPAQIIFLKPEWLNFLEHPPGVQFVHRIFGWLVALSAVGLVVLSKMRNLTSAQRNAFYLVGLMVGVQFLLGVATLVMKVPLTLASMHQMGACILFLTTLRALFLMVNSRNNSTI